VFFGTKRTKTMLRFNKDSPISKILIGAIFLALSQVTIAEDTEIFSNTTENPETNILVIMDNSGSMNVNIEGSSQTRMDALTDAFETFMNNPDIVDLNIGLMGFSNGKASPKPHGISKPIKPLDE
jgi:hypothetical protein